MTAQQERVNIHSWTGAQQLLGQKLHDPEWYDPSQLPDDSMPKIIAALADRDSATAGRIIDLAYQKIALDEVYAETGIRL